MPGRSLALAMLALLVAVALATPSSTSSAGGVASSYLVVLSDGADVDVVQRRARLRALVVPVHTYRHALRGFSASLTAAQVAFLRGDPAVAFIEADRAVSLADQRLPTGVDRVEADQSPTAGIEGTDSRVNADIAIIDTGIEKDHEDLNVAGGVNCTDTASTAPTDWGDGHGHGTHVAGIAGALDNGIGVVGVAPGARLWAVRVFRADGSSLLSWIVCGIDWVTGQKDEAELPIFEAANMSLRDEGTDDGACGSINGDAEHKSICASVAAGVAYAVAAGNDSTTASKWIPAAYDEVITVSALADFNGTGGGGAPSTCSSFRSRDSDDTFADFSNYGPDIDLIAPGKCIYSTYPTSKSTGTGYAVLSGTSMAAPHVAGAIALYRAEHPGLTPTDVKAALQGAGTLDWFTSTDPDAVHERLLNVSSFGRTPDFSLSASPASVTVNRSGGTARYTVDAIRGNGFNGDIALSLIGLPAGVTSSFLPEVLVGLEGLSSALTVTVPRTAPAGTYVLTIVGTSGDIPHSTTVQLVKR